MKKAEFSPSAHSTTPSTALRATANSGQAALRVGLGTKKKKTREKPGLQKLVIFVMFPAVDEA
jgi:hypothetical protein